MTANEFKVRMLINTLLEGFYDGEGEIWAMSPNEAIAVLYTKSGDADEFRIEATDDREPLATIRLEKDISLDMAKVLVGAVKTILASAKTPG